MGNLVLNHIHTWRCGHASHDPDEAYILEAIDINADRICFSDHAPLPGDHFNDRMRCDQLDEYLESLTELKHKYADRIDVGIGLEIEYLPSLHRSGYYDALLADNRLEFLLLGQHFSEDPRCEGEITCDYLQLGNDIVAGIESGHFSAVAHPDRIFEKCTVEWSDEMEALAQRIHWASIQHRVPLEYNMHSIYHPAIFRWAFWLTCPESERIIGLDAHSVNDMIDMYLRMQLTLESWHDYSVIYPRQYAQASVSDLTLMGQTEKCCPRCASRVAERRAPLIPGTVVRCKCGFLYG